MSAENYNTADLWTDLTDIREGNISPEKAKRAHEGLTEAWGMPRTIIGENGRMGVPTTAFGRKLADDPEFAEERYGVRSPFIAAMVAGPEYESGTASGKTERALETLTADNPDSERALIDQGVVGAAAPIEVDPVIVDVQRSAAPELDVIQSVAQAGFQAQYNTINNRDNPIGFLSEAEAAGDLEDQFTPQGFTLGTDTKEMKRHVGLVKVSDFSQRAMQTLEYMDPRNTALGQATIAHSLQKAKAMFYGDPTVGAGDQSIEDGDAFEGIAKMADDNGNSIDKSTVASGFLEDLLYELTTLIQNTGMTWDRARILVSPFFYNAVYEEQTPVIRIDGYEADVEYGPQGIALSTDEGTAPITRAPNIRDYSAELSGVGANSGPGDVFIVDEVALQFRQLAPMSTVPLSRDGLADKVALFEYYSLISKSQGEHMRWLQNYDVPTSA